MASVDVATAQPIAHKQSPQAAPTCLAQTGWGRKAVHQFAALRQQAMPAGLEASPRRIEGAGNVIPDMEIGAAKAIRNQTGKRFSPNLQKEIQESAGKILADLAKGNPFDLPAKAPFASKDSGFYSRDTLGHALRKLGVEMEVRGTDDWCNGELIFRIQGSHEALIARSTRNADGSVASSVSTAKISRTIDPRVDSHWDRFWSLNYGNAADQGGFRLVLGAESSDPNNVLGVADRIATVLRQNLRNL